MTGFEQFDLLHAFRSGDKSAFERVFKMHYNALRVQAFLLLDNKEEAEDQVQQLFLDIWNRELYRNIQDSLKAYLHTAIRNRCLNFIAQSRQRNSLRIVYSENLAQQEEQTETESVLDGRFQHAIEQLPRQRSKAFRLVYLEEKKYLQAAEEMGISINSLKSHLKLAIKFLKIQLQR